MKRSNTGHSKGFDEHAALLGRHVTKPNRSR